MLRIAETHPPKGGRTLIGSWECHVKKMQVPTTSKHCRAYIRCRSMMAIKQKLYLLELTEHKY